MKEGDLELAKLAAQRGWVPPRIIEQALAQADRYQALGLEKSVEEILLEHGALTPDQVRALREALGLSLRQPRVGDYEVLRRVGVGGMGTVFEAQHVRLKQRIALKILLPRLARDPAASERFLREARLLARLNHPHLVHAIDAGQDQDRFYLAMELIDGEDLLQMVLRQGPLSPAASCDIVRDVCEALEVLSSKGLVHRDIKPANILVGKDGVVKLADFGLVAPASTEASTQLACGTPHYVSPEQISRKREPDVRSDLYSLAATWYHLVTGKPPFTGKSTRAILQGHLHGKARPPSSLRPGLPAALDAVILRWLSKEPEGRPATAAAALEEVSRLRLALEPPPPRRRRWAGIMLGAAGVAAACALFFLPSRPGNRESPGKDPVPEAVVHLPPGSSAEPPAPVPPSTTRDPALPVTSPPVSTPPALEGAREATPQPSVVRPALPEAIPLPDPARPPSFDSGKLIDRCASALIALPRRLARASLPLAPRMVEFEPRARLGRSFSARFVAVAPGSDTFAVELDYPFDAPRELGDFRAAPDSWRIVDGALEGSAAPEGQALWSVAWFGPGVRLSGRLAAESSLIVGLEDLAVAPGKSGDARVWREDEGRPVPVLAAPAVPEGTFSVVFHADEVECEVAGKSFRLPAPGKSLSLTGGRGGRVFVKLAPGRRLDRLHISGTLLPAWAVARSRAR